MLVKKHLKSCITLDIGKSDKNKGCDDLFTNDQPQILAKYYCGDQNYGTTIERVAKEIKTLYNWSFSGSIIGQSLR